MWSATVVITGSALLSGTVSSPRRSRCVTVERSPTLHQDTEALMREVNQELLEALKAMLSCFDDKGTLIIYPGSSQFKPVDDATEAIDILTAARRAVANAEPKFRPIPSYGSLMALDSFLDNCDRNCLVDYDGHGFLATDDQSSNIHVLPSNVREIIGHYPWATHVMWFNK